MVVGPLQHGAAAPSLPGPGGGGTVVTPAGNVLGGAEVEEGGWPGLGLARLLGVDGHRDAHADLLGRELADCHPADWH